MFFSVAATAAGYFIFMPISFVRSGGGEGRAERSSLPLVLLPHLVVSELWGSRFIAQVESTVGRWLDVPYGDMGRTSVGSSVNDFLQCRFFDKS